MPEPITMRAIVTFRSFDPDLDMLVPLVRDVMQTHPTLNFRVDDVRVEPVPTARAHAEQLYGVHRGHALGWLGPDDAPVPLWADLDGPTQERWIHVAAHSLGVELHASTGA